MIEQKSNLDKNRDIQNELDQRIKIEQETRRRLALQQIISNIALRFVQNHDIHKAIDLALEELSNFTSSCRCYFFRFDYDKNTASVTNEWCAPGITPQKEKLQDIPLDTLRWFTEKLEKNGKIDIPDVSKMPPSARAEKESLKLQDVKSLHLFAVYINGKICGTVGFDNCKTTLSWSNSDLISLRMFASILGNVLGKDLYLQQVIQSKARYKSIIEDKNLLVTRLDADLNITFTNHTIKEYFGLENEELVGKNIQDIVPNRKIPNMTNRLKQLNARKYWGDLEDKIFTAGKGVRWVDWRYSGIFNDNGELQEIHFVGKDITDKKLAENKIKKTLNFNKKIIDSSTMGIIVYNADGECLKANDAAAEITGTTVSEIMKLNIYNSFFSEKTGFTQAVKKAFSTGQAEYCDVKGFNSFGKELELFLKVMPFEHEEGRALLVMIENLLPMKTALREKEKADTTSSIINAMTEGLVVHDKKGIIVSMNSAFERDFTETKEKLIGFSMDELIETIMPESGQKDLLENYQKSLQGKSVTPVVFSLRGPNGEPRYYERTISYINDPEDEDFRVVRTYKDLTIHHITSENLNERTRQLELSNKELEQFAYVASHDLQEPLRMVSSFLQLLSRKYSGKIDETADTYINHAVDGATRMQMLIKDLMSYSRLDSQGSEFAEVDCNSLLQKLINDIHVLINEKNASITWEDLPVIWADGGQIYRLFSNLVRNGIKYSNEEIPIIQISASKEKDTWEFMVKDNGIGIPPKFQDRIFRIFQRLHGHDEYSGTGIGLPICKKIIENHTGEIWVESESGKGSSFFFTIPVKKG